MYGFDSRLWHQSGLIREVAVKIYRSTVLGDEGTEPIKVAALPEDMAQLAKDIKAAEKDIAAAEAKLHSAMSARRAAANKCKHHYFYDVGGPMQSSRHCAVCAKFMGFL